MKLRKEEKRSGLKDESEMNCREGGGRRKEVQTEDKLSLQTVLLGILRRATDEQGQQVTNRQKKEAEE